MMRLFPIKRNLLRIDVRKGLLHPGDKATLDGFRIDVRKHPIKGIMGWNTSGKRQKGLEPLLLRVGDNGNFCEGIQRLN